MSKTKAYEKARFFAIQTVKIYRLEDRISDENILNILEYLRRYDRLYYEYLQRMMKDFVNAPNRGPKRKQIADFLINYFKISEQEVRA